MEKKNILPAIRQSLTENDPYLTGVRHVAEKVHPVDFAEALESLSLPDILRILKFSDKSFSAQVLAYMNPALRSQVVSEISDEDLAGFIDEMPSDDRVDMLRSIEEERAERLLNLLQKEERRDIKTLQSYREGTAGSIMTTDFAVIPSGVTVAAAIERLRKEAHLKETIYYTYVTDRAGRLAGRVTLQDLIMADPETSVNKLIKKDIVTVTTDDDREIAAEKLKKYDLIALPVIDEKGKLAGIITHDDIADVMTVEFTEDFHKFGGMSHGELDIDLNPKTAGFFTMVRKRLPWLLALVFMNVFSGAGIAYFEDVISSMVALVFFLPLLIDSGGNAGSQSATLMVRSLALGDVTMKDWFRLLVKEFGVALAMGIVMAIGVSLIGIFRAGPDIAIVVSLTMVLTVMFGSLVGLSLPFILTKLKMDPATASAPLITSIADIGGVLIYFSIASWYLHEVMMK